MSQQVFTTNSLGGFFTNNQLSKEVRYISQTLQMFRRFTKPEKAIGKNRGDRVLFDKFSNIATAGGSLVETSTVPKTNWTTTQGSIVVTEYGNSIPFTQKLRALGDLSVDDVTRTVLINDQRVVLDSAAAAQFTAADFKATVTNTATTTIGSAAAALDTAGASMSDKTVRDVVDEMKRRNMPRYDMKNYICIASTNSIRGLYDFFEAKANLTTLRPALSGEVGTYYGTRFMEETNFLSNILGTNANTGEAVFFGDDAVREGIALPEEIRIKISTDYGRDLGLAWYGILGWQKVWDFTDDADARIIHLTSL